MNSLTAPLRNRLARYLQRRCFRQLRSCERGVSSIEFAFMAPIFLLIVAGIVDIGGALVARSDISAAVSAGSNFLLVNAPRVPSAPEEVARQAAVITGNSLPAGGITRITINGGLTVEYSGGKFAINGDRASASQCFCPQKSAGAMTLGSPLECGKPCEAGGYAGRYVQISAAHDYSPLFGGFGMMPSNGVTSIHSMVNVP